MRRIVSLWLPHFITEHPWQQTLGSREQSFAKVRRSQNRLELAGVNGPAHKLGLYGGQPLSDATAMVPDLITLSENAMTQRIDHQAADHLVHWLGQFSPWISLDETLPDAGFIDIKGGLNIWIDASGCTRLFGGERSYLETLHNKLNTLGLTGCLAMADTPGAAWALARYGQGNLAVCPSNQQRDWLKFLFLIALRLPDQTVENLDKVGLRQIGDLYDLPSAPLALRYGQDVARKLKQALGLEREAINTANGTEPLQSHFRFQDAVWDQDSVQSTLRSLTFHLCDRMSKQGLGAQRFRLGLFSPKGEVYGLEIGLVEASQDPAHCYRLIQAQSEKIELVFAIEVVALTVTFTGPVQSNQQSAFGQDNQTNGLASLFDGLRFRLGEKAVYRPAIHESHIPEFSAGPSFHLPLGTAAKDRLPVQRRSKRWRPLHLLAKPQPIDIDADARLRPARLKWRQREQDLVSVEGPERISPEWWEKRQEDYRDYYQVRDATGRAYWIFYSKNQKRWFLHGEA